ncbi:MAG: B12-binding domain-containing radical SAM protein [Planctomycetes bacterium]|jgi:anaerobic magnesium-protoporphyrin IX monomethyl ester cyclase|nr:B12-binding domain-containing radical SAM protein [Planctomycetota bacterium]
MERRITLVNPPYERIAPGYEFVRHVTNRSPSLGLLHLASVARERGWTPVIVESDAESLDAQAVIERVVASRPDVVGITLFTVGVWSAAQVARGIRRALPEVPILVGGPHISSMGRETLERFPDFDLAVVGEGEWALEELLDYYERGGDLARIAGLLWRDAQGVRANAPQPIRKELDELPMPAWDLLPGFPAAYPPAIFDYPRGPVATLAASRGCPFHCRFCDTSTFGARVRAYTPAAVVRMIEHLHTNWGVRHVLFVDDLFLASRTRVTEFCERLLETKLGITWTCTARVDTVKPQVLALMKRAGCWEISFGLETGSDELLRKMDKDARVAESEQAVAWTHAAGIRTKGLFMLGYPGETAETIRMTRDFVRRIPMDIMNLTKFTPYPGSPIYEELYGTKIRPDHWQKMNGMNFVWSPEGISIEQLDREYQALLLAFYRRPRVGKHYVAMALSNPDNLRRLSRFGLGYLWAKVRSLAGGRRGLLVEPAESLS